MKVPKQIALENPEEIEQRKKKVDEIYKTLEIFFEEKIRQQHIAHINKIHLDSETNDGSESRFN